MHSFHSCASQTKYCYTYVALTPDKTLPQIMRYVTFTVCETKHCHRYVTVHQTKYYHRYVTVCQAKYCHRYVAVHQTNTATDMLQYTRQILPQIRYSMPDKYCHRYVTYTRQILPQIRYSTPDKYCHRYVTVHQTNTAIDMLQYTRQILP